MNVQIHKFVKTLYLLSLVLLLAACQRISQATEPSGNPTFIQTVEVVERDGEYYALVYGWYPDACSQTGDIVQEVDGDTISLTIYSTKPEGLVCAQVLTEFTEEIFLDTDGLEPGEYTIIVNHDNAKTTFTLE